MIVSNRPHVGPAAGLRRTLRERLMSLCPTFASLSAGYVLMAVIQFSDFTFSGKPTRDFLFIIVAMQVSAYATIRIFACFHAMGQIGLLIAVFGLQTAAWSCFQVEGFMGDGRPIITWKWEWATETDWTKPSPAPAKEIDVVETSFDSPAFRGRDRNGIYAVDLSSDWTEPPRLRWKRSVGPGWSSFAVVGDLCVTHEQRGAFESVVGYDLRSGDQRWVHHDSTRFHEVTGGPGPRATPAIHAGRVYALGATGLLNCLDAATGKPIWQANVLEDSGSANCLFGVVGSPLIHGDKVVVSPGGPKGALAAYDQETGERIWAGGSAHGSYSSPHAANWTLPQILSFNAAGLTAHSAESGAVLWDLGWVSNPEERNNVCQPVPIPRSSADSPERVFIASGYGQGCGLFDVVRSGNEFTVVEVWRSRSLGPKFSSVIQRAGFVYGIDGKILTCVDLADGRRRWKRGRYGYGQLLSAGGHLIVQCESGEVALVEASPDRFRELGRFTALDDRTWNQPVLRENLLLVRNDREAACYELPLAKVADSP